MTLTLQNEQLRVGLRSQGAELTSIRDNASDTEFLWHGDPAYWNRHAPILFPIVGKLKDDRFRVGDECFEMTQHGFARDVEFDVVERDDARARLELRDTETTAVAFPFRFVLSVDYSLIANALRVEYAVTNPDDRPISFSIGAHPAFACPIEPHEDASDYFLEFELEETASRWMLQDGLLGEERKRYLDGARMIRLGPGVFDEDALIFKNLASNTVSLRSTKGPRCVTMDFTGFPYLGIWSKPGGAPFVCIEPWHGLADAADFDGAFTDKEGVLELNAGEEFRCQYSMSFT